MHIDLHLGYSLLNFCKIWDGKEAGDEREMLTVPEKWIFG